MRALAVMLLLFAAACAPKPAPVAEAPVKRIAVMSAFQPELVHLKANMESPKEEVINGVTFITGKMAGKDVVLFLSGVSMVNAAMTTQLALDHFEIDRIVFSGIAGGVDPALDVGDVVVADKWGQYLETTMARKVKDGFEISRVVPPNHDFKNFGMMYVNDVQIARGAEPLERRFWFDVDPAMMAVAKTAVLDVPLKDCVDDVCLAKKPRVIVGGNGVSGPAFVDNAELREWAFANFEAKVLDMETAAVAHVAHVNKTPFIAFRSLSDLAGGDPGKNQARVFFQLASDNSAAVVLTFLKALP